ncbi:MAG: peptide deformylase [Clostridia bacterium]|nr:peptide deformylase [Clostridia bacterium]
MIREIIHDPVFLAQPSSEATEADLPVAVDLIDTLKANLDRCVGMAANMIGKKKRIIVMARGPLVVAMINPKILSASGEYEAEEGCLSLEGVRKTKRYRSIRLQWQDMQMKVHTGTLDGFQAQIVQHEIDHCSGVLV